jgi:tetratricopeptide (TPR) repeat protein
MWRWNLFVPVAIVSIASSLLSLSPAIALEPPEIAAQAAKFVVKIDGAGGGTGFIVRKNGDRYTVLTNKHVIRAAANYTIITVDNRSYGIDSSQTRKFAGVDLAEVEFTSANNYAVAEFSNSTTNPLGGKIYTYGFNSITQGLPERTPQFLQGTIAGNLPSGRNGYSLTFNLTVIPGLSGSPLLDENGKVIGIYGSVDRQGESFTVTLGIPITTYLKYFNSARSTTIIAPNNPTNPVVKSTSTLTNQASQSLEKSKSLLRQAAGLVQFQQYEEAIPRVLQAIQLAPTNHEAWFFLGTLYVQIKKYDKGIEALQQGKALRPLDSDILFMLGSAYFQKGDYQKAINSIQSGLIAKPDNNSALFDLGNSYYKLNKYSDAIAQYQKAVKKDPKFWPAINNIGLVSYEMGDINVAIQNWERVSSIDPKAAEPIFALAAAFFTQGKRAEAYIIIERAISLDSRYANIQYLKDNLWGSKIVSDISKLIQTPRVRDFISKTPSRG